jgi:hypothetical protein
MRDKKKGRHLGALSAEIFCLKSDHRTRLCVIDVVIVGNVFLEILNKHTGQFVSSVVEVRFVGPSVTGVEKKGVRSPFDPYTIQCVFRRR